MQPASLEAVIGGEIRRHVQCRPPDVALPPDPRIETTKAKKSGCRTCGGDEKEKDEAGGAADGKAADLDHMFGGSSNGEPQVMKVAAADPDLAKVRVEYVMPDGKTWVNSWSQMNVDNNVGYVKGYGARIISITPGK